MNRSGSRGGACHPTRRISYLLIAATQFVTLMTLSARATRATLNPCPCAYVTGGRAIYTSAEGLNDLGQDEHIRYPSSSDQVHLIVNLSDGSRKDVSLLPLAVTYASGGQGYFADERYVPCEADINREFPLYAIYQDPCTGQTWTFTVHLHVD